MDERQDNRGKGLVMPRGILVAVGGNEDKENDLEILRSTVTLAKTHDPSIALITCASGEPEITSAQYLDAFHRIEVKDVHVLHMETRDEALDVEKLSKVKDADIVFFTGGDQLRLSSILGGTPILTEIRRKYLEDYCIVAGTSAGASALSETMIYEGNSPEALKKGTVQMTAGLGLVRKIVFDSHFIKRGRFSRLMEMVATNPGIIGIGLGEDTGVIVRDGHLLEAIGQGLIAIFDGKQIVHTNITNIELGQAIAVQNVIVHTLVKGYSYDTFTRAYIEPDK